MWVLGGFGRFWSVLGGGGVSLNPLPDPPPFKGRFQEWKAFKGRRGMLGKTGKTPRNTFLFFFVNSAGGDEGLYVEFLVQFWTFP